MGESERRRLTVAIDGPAGAGKSTAARGLAQRLGYTLIDTGAIYRTLALVARQRGIDWADEATLAMLAADLAVDFALEGEVNRVFVSGVEVTREIRSPEISNGASQVSALPAVRAALLELQRRLGRRGGVVAEGRDVGTVVFPDAGAKFFLIASTDERARRRVSELQATGSPVDAGATRHEMLERDQRDSTRAAAPLRQADDAIVVDSTALRPEAVVERMVGLVRARGG